MSIPRPRLLAALGLLGVVPAAVFVVGRGDPTAPVLAALSVLIIVASLATMLSPADAEAGEPAP